MPIYFDFSLAPDEVKENIHLAIPTKNQTSIALVGKHGDNPGSPIVYVDPHNQDNNILFLVKSLSKQEWVLQCACGKTTCNLEWTLKVRRKGRHPLPDAVVQSEE